MTEERVQRDSATVIHRALHAPDGPSEEKNICTKPSSGLKSQWLVLT